MCRPESIPLEPDLGNASVGSSYLIAVVFITLLHFKKTAQYTLGGFCLREVTI